MRCILIFLTVVVLLVPGLVVAQGDTMPYTSPGDSFSMDIPDDWEIVEESEVSVMFNIPLENPGNPSSEGIVVELDRMVAIFALESHEDETAETVLVAQYEDLALNYPPGEPILLTVNNMPAAYVDGGADFLGSRWIVVDLGEEQFIVVSLAGTLDQRWLATPLILDVVNTLRLEGDDTPVEELVVVEELGETYARPEDQLTFEYPAHWSLEEQTSYTLLILPTGSSVGISGEVPGFPVDEEFVELVIDDVIQRIEENTDMTVEEEPIKFEINYQPGISFVGIDPVNNESYIYIVVQLNDEMIGVISGIGYPDEIRILRGTLMAIAESMSVED